MSPPSGPVHIPTVDEWYQSLQLFHPVYLDGCDIELGHDWLTSVSPICRKLEHAQCCESTTDIYIT